MVEVMKILKVSKDEKYKARFGLKKRINVVLMNREARDALEVDKGDKVYLNSTTVAIVDQTFKEYSKDALDYSDKIILNLNLSKKFAKMKSLRVSKAKGHSEEYRSEALED